MRFLALFITILFVVTTTKLVIANLEMSNQIDQLEKDIEQLEGLDSPRGYYRISPIDSQTVLVDDVMPVYTKDLEAFLYDEYYSINDTDYTAEW